MPIGFVGPFFFPLDLRPNLSPQDTATLMVRVIRKKLSYEISSIFPIPLTVKERESLNLLPHLLLRESLKLSAQAGTSSWRSQCFSIREEANIQWGREKIDVGDGEEGRWRSWESLGWVIREGWQRAGNEMEREALINKVYKQDWEGRRGF